MNQVKIGNFISEKRKEQNLTQSQLAERIGVSNKTVSKWECGRSMPDYSVIEILCNELNINISELIKGNSSEELSKTDKESMLQLYREIEHLKINNLTNNAIHLNLLGIIIYCLSFNSSTQAETILFNVSSSIVILMGISTFIGCIIRKHKLSK